MNLRRYLSRGLTIAAISFAVIVLAIVLAVHVEEARGLAAWNAYRDAWNAKGEILEWYKLIPAEVEAEENYAAAPVFTSAAWQKLVSDDATGMEGLRLAPVWQRGLHWTWNALAPDEPSPETRWEEIMGRLQPVMGSIADAARKPHCRFNLDYASGVTVDIDALAPHREWVDLFLVRAWQAVKRGDSEAAAEDLETALRLTTHYSSLPGLISHLVACYRIQTSLQVLWEGLNARLWHGNALDRVDAILQGLDLEAGYLKAAREDRSVMLLELERLVGDRGGTSTAGIRFTWFPKGWVYRNMVTHCRHYEESVLAPSGTLATRLDLAAARRATAAFERRMTDGLGTSHPYSMLCVGFTPALDGGVEIALETATCVDLGRVAIALEAFREREGHYPQVLEALRPAHLDVIPDDRISRSALCYGLNSKGAYAVYSVGPDGDDDGARVMDESGDGDWGWRYEFE